MNGYFDQDDYKINNDRVSEKLKSNIQVQGQI